MPSQTLPLFWIDAFSFRPFEGNPAAVVPLDAWLDDALLQRIANENGLSETAFFVRKGSGHFHLRWFTPHTEIDLCGHATLASAYVLFEELGEMSEVLRFDTKSGLLEVRRDEHKHIELNFPSRPPQACETKADFEKALGAKPTLVLKNLNNWFCVFDRMEALTRLSPDFSAIRDIAPGRVIVSAPGDESCDFASRFFAPGVGIDEDPVTGSAHCALIPYWSKRLGKTSLVARQVSRRGGKLWCHDDGERCRMAGQAVLYLKGELRLP